MQAPESPKQCHTTLNRNGDRVFCAYASRLWNKLLIDNIKAADSVKKFTKQLKTLLFQKEFI